ncbi:ribosomal protein YmL35 [Neohortaea acidophila]|uniref:Large ribosomal subunit protein mL38 n=1 Tax=Neohortaea acidophila TaxID=245834 RepID=A0A6A6Q3L3_9PEZI|nr:ribosomal protein YmL35 [Neohortaea acidophila]KAF2486243.1 ribosomal protein YmL35 [Neohortaea acidophila]
MTMALEGACRPMARCVQRPGLKRINLQIRTFTTSNASRQEVTDITSTSSPPLPANPFRSPESSAAVVHKPQSERRLIAQHGIYPIGSRRRRAAIASTPSIPFHQLPYQCFQEARKVLQQDRVEKVAEIAEQRRRMEKVQTSLAQSQSTGDEPSVKQLERRLRDMRQHLEELKILADINDPLVRKKFEDGLGDMNKPIYRHLADKKWRSYKRKVLVQRITQMNVVPDILPHIDPTIAVSLSFGRKDIPHGGLVLSTLSEDAPSLNIQPFDRGERLVTIAVINPDVPNVAKDGFGYRCHFLASNISISPTQTRVDLASLDPESQVILPWLPAFAQKGLDYQRMGVFVLQQGSISEEETSTSTTEEQSSPANLPVQEILSAARYSKRENFVLRSFVDKYSLHPVGVDLFRTQWDEGTAGVMRRAGIPGWDVEFKRKRIYPLPYRRLKEERYR